MIIAGWAMTGKIEFAEDVISFLGRTLVITLKTYGKDIVYDL